MTALPYRYITLPEERDEAILRLSSHPVIGVDIEGDSLYHYQDKVCLVQISGGEENFIFDPLLLDTIEPLSSLFKNEKIVKIFHGAEYDLISLKRDFGFTILTIFDTVLAARAVGIKAFSLQNLVSLYFNIALVKTHQKANWSKRPISTDQLEYAYKDTSFLAGLYERLVAEVEKKGRQDQIQEECFLLQERVWEEKEFSSEKYFKIKGAKNLPEGSQKILRELVIAREQQAKDLDRPPFKVISNEDLFLLAKQPPHSLEELKVLFPRQTASVFRNPVFWLKTLSLGEKSHEPLPLKVKKGGAPPTPAQEKRFTELKKWRDAQAVEEGVEPAMIISTDVLRSITSRDIHSPERLSESGLLRQWQIKRYGQKIDSI
ncbi:MAG: HRDC domain-containing protein [Nitrospirae bacterium]|nr:HRDC domain-containing protein [Nitrospirota bacterium]MBI3352299.1 HRDC domain-containing protein [Nitrospirota bacterium]